MERLHEQRPRLRALAYRMLGSVSEAEDALQEAWLRVHRSPPGPVDNLDGWLTTAVAHTCLDLLRARSRRELPAGVHLPDPLVGVVASPEDEAVLAESVGLAVQVVLDRLTPGERLAFVLHDGFGVPFARIAALLDREPAAVRQLASRARRRVRAAPVPDTDVAGQRRVVDAFFAAARRGDFDALIDLLDPEITLRADAGPGRMWEIHGPQDAAGRALLFARPDSDVRPVLVHGAAGAVVLLAGEPAVLLAFTVVMGRIAEIDVFADPARVRALTAG
nr:sigma-70 family RNA polymerase sigma factor [Nocardia transvalensis]